MPTLSASDYTTYLKFKAAAATPIRPAIQTRDNATTNQSVLNANVLASQAAFVVSPTTGTIVNNARVVGVQAEKTNIPYALSTVTGSGTLSSSRVPQSGGLPTGFKSSTNTYTRLPQNAGW